MADAEEFVRFFAEGWRKPKPEAFIEHFAARLAPDARLVQPMAPAAIGVEGFRELFRGILELFPDYEVRVEDWAARENVVFIWVAHSTTIGGRRVGWAGVDRVVLNDEGLIEERIALFDPTEQLPALLRAPGIWPPLVRMSLARRRPTTPEDRH